MEKINIAELLKNYPKGMELDCAMYDNLYFNQIYDDECLYKIGCYTIVDESRTTVNFTEFGAFDTHLNSKCVIFPKGKTTWEGFQRPFKDGDIVVHTQNNRLIISILKGEEFKHKSIITPYCVLWDEDEGLSIDSPICFYADATRPASKEEKAKLFQAIKDNGYKWDEETKTLEKLIEPMFKVGDRIIPKDSKNESRVINAILDNEYNLFGGGKIPFIDQDNYELVPNKFDISTLKPFDKVLVRDTDDEEWNPDFYGYKRGEFQCVQNYWCQCIPYKGNEHLLGTTDACDEFYKTWLELL